MNEHDPPPSAESGPPAPDTTPALSPPPVTTAPVAPATPPPPRNWLRVGVFVLALAAGGSWLWHVAQERAEREARAEAEAAQQRDALQSRIEGLRRDVRSHGQRLQQADATNRALRDELIGMGQRATVLEDQVAKLADASREGAQALRLDEAELLLTLGEQRLRLAADLDGARRAHALAAGVLEGVDSPAALNLRQALAQERAALDALDADPRIAALAGLDAFARALPPDDAAPAQGVDVDATAPWWERVLARLVQVRRADEALAVSAHDRAAARIGLELELSLARTAAERRDADAYRAALSRAEQWLPRLWPGGGGRRGELGRLRTLPLAPDLPTLGSTLQLLRAQRAGRA
jgi:uroporphyrin-3 C-methyltransferase